MILAVQNLLLLFSISSRIVSGYPHDSPPLSSSTAPWDTSFAQLWQDHGEWHNGTHDSLETRALIPPNGAGQLVAFKRLSDSSRYNPRIFPNSRRFVVSLAIVVWDAGSHLCTHALWIDSNDRFANAVATQGWDIMRSWSLNQFERQDVLYSWAANGAATLIVKTTIDAMRLSDIQSAASRLAMRWNLGAVVQNFLPENRKMKRDLGGVPIMGIISEGRPWAREEMTRLSEILEALPTSEVEPTSGTEEGARKRAGCENIALQGYRVTGRSVWDTIWSTGC